MSRVHDLRIWAMGSSQVALTAHLVMPQGQADDAFLKQASDHLHDRFEIGHVTLQVMKQAFTEPCGKIPTGHTTHSTSHDHDHHAHPVHRGMRA